MCLSSSGTVIKNLLTPLIIPVVNGHSLVLYFQVLQSNIITISPKFHGFFNLLFTFFPFSSVMFMVAFTSCIWLNELWSLKANASINLLLAGRLFEFVATDQYGYPTRIFPWGNIIYTLIANYLVYFRCENLSIKIELLFSELSLRPQLFSTRSSNYSGTSRTKTGWSQL